MKEWLITIEYDFEEVENRVTGGEFGVNKGLEKSKEENLPEALQKFKQKEKDRIINEIVLERAKEDEKYFWKFDKDMKADDLSDKNLNFSQARVK
jgi:hypothetical protein